MRAPTAGPNPVHRMSSTASQYRARQAEVNLATEGDADLRCAVFREDFSTRPRLLVNGLAEE